MTVFVFDASGNYVPPTAEELARADEFASIISYSYGTMEDGRPYWAYVAVKPSLYQKFYALSAAKKTIIIGDYGTVIAAGYGVEPPPEVIREMQEKYGCDPRYEEKLIAEVRKQQLASISKRDEKRIMDIVAMLKSQKPASTS